MKPLFLFLPAALLAAAVMVGAQSPPLRSTFYEGISSTEVRHPAAVYAPQASMTIEAWVYREDASRCETILSQDFNQSFWFGFCGGNLRFYRGGTGSVDATAGVPSHRWTHVAVRYVGALERAYFYIDGELVSSALLAPPASHPSLPLYVGSDPNGGFFGHYNFHGALDEVRLWSVARTAAQIRDHRFQEITSAPGLVAAFPSGGFFNAVTAASAAHTSGARQQIAGILPRDLVIPEVPSPIPVDGTVLLPPLEGAEQLVLRYHNGEREVDTVAHLVWYRHANISDRRIHVSIADWEDLPAGVNYLYLTWGADAAGRQMVGANDFRTRFQSNTGAFVFQQGNPSFGSFATASQGSAAAAMGFCRGEFNPPCLEMTTRYESTSAYQNLGLMLHLHSHESDAPPGGVERPSPFDAHPSFPATWPQATLGGPIGPTTDNVIRIRVTEEFYDQEHPVSITPIRIRVTDSNTLERLQTYNYSTYPTDFDYRTFRFDTLVNTPLLIDFDPPAGWQILAVEAEPHPEWTQPTGFNPSGAYFPGAGEGTRNLATLNFRVRAVPADPIAATGFDPAEGSQALTVRTDPLIVVPGDDLILLGSNFHARTRVYLTTCDAPPLQHYTQPWEGPCSQGQFHLLPPPQVHSSRSLLRVRLETTTAPEGPLRVLLLNDSGVGPRWTLLPDSFLLRRQPYPFVHGFEFKNERDGTQFDAFSAIYRHNAYDCHTPLGPIPHLEDCPGCRLPNPLYAQFYGFVFTGWAELMTGSCFGMSAVSLMFARGQLDPAAFQPGAEFAFGLSGIVTDDGIEPPKPQEFNWRFCNYSEPVNLWSHIHLHQASQISAEILGEVLAQMTGADPLNNLDSIGGSPLNVLNQFALSPTKYVLAMQNAGNPFEAHAVVPYRLQHDVGVNEDGLAVVPKPGHSVLYLYDNNWPGRERHLEIDRTANIYRYRIGSTKVSEGVFVEKWFGGRGLYLVSADLFQQAKTIPAFENLGMVILGSATAVYEDGHGGRWGWDGEGALHDTFPGAKSFAPFASPTAGLAQEESGRPPTAFFFPPEDAPPAAIRIHPRGSDYRFHAGGQGTLINLWIGNRNSGGIDDLTLLHHDGRLAGFEFSPAENVAAFDPVIGFARGEEQPLVFQWEGVIAYTGGTVGFVADPSRDAATFINRSGEPTLTRLVVRHAGAEKELQTRFGPFIVFDGSAGTVVVEEVAETLFASLEIDLTGNGIPDVITTLDPETGSFQEEPPPLRIRLAEPGTVRVSWDLTAAPWMLETTTSLEPGSIWVAIDSIPNLTATEASMDFPVGEAPLFLRLRRLW